MTLYQGDAVGSVLSRNHDYESELTATRDDRAAVLSGVADGILAGCIRLGDGANAVVVDTPEESTLEILRDQTDEWRWRLRHHNGNISATSGEGYTQKHNAQKGLRSVMQNAPEAETVEGSEN